MHYVKVVKPNQRLRVLCDLERVSEGIWCTQPHIPVRTIKLCGHFQEGHKVDIREYLPQVHIDLPGAVVDIWAPYQDIGGRSFNGLAARRDQDKVRRVNHCRSQVLFENHFVKFQLGFLHGEDIAEYLLGGIVVVGRKANNILGDCEDHFFPFIVLFEDQDTS